MVQWFWSLEPDLDYQLVSFSALTLFGHVAYRPKIVYYVLS